MLFNSYIFIFVFLPIVLFGAFVLRSNSHMHTKAKAWLLLASLIFYGYWNIKYLLLLLISIIFNHQIGHRINTAAKQNKKSKILLISGIAVNLFLIGYYKYFGFFLHSSNQLIKTSFDIPEIVLPLAISFYTFTQIAYLVDAYRGETKDLNYNILDYGLFVSFFPQLIAGPILRHNDLIPQFDSPKTFISSNENIANGLTLFTLGLAKKVLIADNLSPFVSLAFGNVDSLTFLSSWIGALSYTFQLYFDFSGYSDMAIGLGYLFNIHLPINFNSPYKAISIIDFWRRWHITLSNFLRDYLYIPLGGNRKGEIRRYANLLVTMFLGGLWHGAGWTFIIWGLLHGFYLAINHLYRRVNFRLNLPSFIGGILTFLCVVFSWVIFRAPSFSNARTILKAMVGMNGFLLSDSVFPSPLFQMSILVFLVVGVTLLPNTQEIMQKFKPTWAWAIAGGSLASLSLLSLNRVSEFLYFQF